MAGAHSKLTGGSGEEGEGLASTRSSGTSHGESATTGRPRLQALACLWADCGRCRPESVSVEATRKCWRFSGRSIRGTRGVTCESPPGEDRERGPARGGSGRGVVGGVRRGREGGVLLEADSQASACGHGQTRPAPLFSPSRSPSRIAPSRAPRMGVGHGPQEKPNPRGASAQVQTFPSRWPAPGRTDPRKQWPREGRGDPERGGDIPRSPLKAAQSFSPPPRLPPPLSPLPPGTPRSSLPSFLLPLFPPPAPSSPVLLRASHSAPLPGPSPPLLFGRPLRQSPPPRAPARPSPPPRFWERLGLPSQAALRGARSRAICQRSQPGGAARPAGARVTGD